MANVLLEKVTKRFGDVIAVNDVTIQVHDREFLVLVGPSGCGKTTSLRMVAGLEEADAGRIFIGDRDVTHQSPKNRDIAMVFQSYALYPHMSVYDNMGFALRLRGTPRSEIERRVKEAAELLGIGDLMRRKPRQLSGGQRQRVAVGRAIVRYPQVFLMDEPLSNLDAKLRVQTRAELIKLHQRLEATVIYVTHDQVEAMTMGTRIAVMNDGLVQQLDTPQNIYERPANMFVAGFIGSPAMNFFEGTLVGSAEAAAIKLPGWQLPLTDEQRRRWASRIGQQVIVGIRPEYLLAGFSANGKQPVGEGRIEVIELLGSEAILYLRIGEVDLVSRQPYQPGLQVNQPVPIALDLDRLHLFDPQTQAVIAS